MSSPRQPMYRRLPEIYRIRDEELQPPLQLKAYVDLFDEVHAAMHENIGALYDDLFIETCDDWVIPYLADALGVSHLSGDAWTLRADVARTIHHRRRKGTLGAIESLTYALTGWAAHAAEMRDRLVWNQHLNHQRPDEGGLPPLTRSRFLGDARRGGTVNLRDPALLSLIGTPFDPFAHVVDVKPSNGTLGLHNLPNLAIFLWRLKTYTVARARPGFVQIADLTGTAGTGEALYAVRLELHPQAEPMVLFNTHRFDADADPPELSTLDAVPGAMPWARLSSDTPAGRPQDYVEVETYPANTVPPALERLGLGFLLTDPPFAGVIWRFRGANLCAWESGLHPPLREHEIAIDPRRGRVVFGAIGANQAAEADPIAAGVVVSATYASPGPVGAHPIARTRAPATWLEQTPQLRIVDTWANPAFTLQDALANLPTSTVPVIVEIRDNRTHTLDLAAVTGSALEGGLQTLRLARSLWIRGGDDVRPVIRLVRPLAFRPDDVLGASAPAVMDTLAVRLEGLYLTRDTTFPANAPLIARAALNQLHVHDCTLDPGGYTALNGTRAPIRDAMRLTDDYGFAAANERDAFDQIPEIVLQRSIAGPMAIDGGYRVDLADSILDAGSGIGDAAPALALCSATGNPELAWGPPLTVSGLTCFGRMRVFSASGQGGIWLHPLRVRDNQSGCLRYCWFSGNGDWLPSHHACLFAHEADLHFVSERFGAPAYAQIAQSSDPRILDQGPGNDEMGAYGFQLSTHRWKNIQIRYREYMPVGVRPVLVAVT
jgi:hypothetical protein